VGNGVDESMVAQQCAELPVRLTTKAAWNHHTHQG
jgi:hypothetical protein